MDRKFTKCWSLGTRKIASWVKFHEESESDVKTFKFRVFQAENWISICHVSNFEIESSIFEFRKSSKNAISSCTPTSNFGTGSSASHATGSTILVLHARMCQVSFRSWRHNVARLRCTQSLSNSNDEDDILEAEAISKPDWRKDCGGSARYSKRSSGTSMSDRP